MSFVLNNQGVEQLSLFDSFNILTEREKKFLSQSWARYFAEHIFPNIDEKPYVVLYRGKDSRPNTPVNIQIGGLLIKELANRAKHQRECSAKEFKQQSCYRNGVRNYPTDRSGRTCFYAQSARRTFGRLQIIITLYHNILRTESNAHQTAGTFFLIQPVNASRILRNHTCIAHFRTFSTLCAHSNMMASILLVGNADAGFHWIRNLVKCLRTGFFALVAANAE